MKLYYSPGACSLAPHIVAREAGVDLQLARVDVRSHKTVDGDADYYAVNPTGQVPFLVLDSGESLAEGAVIAQYLAESAKATALLPAGGLPRYQVLAWQNHVGSELHKSYGPLFNPMFDDAAKASARKLLRRKYEHIDAALQGRAYLTGDAFTVADAYLFVVTRWAPNVQVDTSGLANLAAFMQRVGERAAVQAAMKAEGL